MADGEAELTVDEKQANVYLTDMANFAVMNKAYMELVPGKEGAPMPARYVVCFSFGLFYLRVYLVKREEAVLVWFADWGKTGNRTCVCVKELPLKTDVEIECIAHL